MICQLVTELLVACRPLLIVGKGAAYAQADAALTALADATGIPFLSTAMGRGVVPDSHASCVQAARSLALARADVAVIVGARYADLYHPAGLPSIVLLWPLMLQSHLCMHHG